MDELEDKIITAIRNTVDLMSLERGDWRDEEVFARLRESVRLELREILNEIKRRSIEP